MSGLLVAQESVTSTTVKWIIVALLVVAALLTVLTVWYWRHTDPRQRAAAARRAPVERAPAPRSASPANRPAAAPNEWMTSPAPTAADAAAEARRRAQTAGSARSVPPMSPPRLATDDLEADDWLRLTGPQALPRDGT